MRVLIQNRSTHEYLAQDNRWCEDPDFALRFISPGRALAYCQERSLANAQVVMKFTRVNQEIPLSVFDGGGVRFP